MCWQSKSGTEFARHLVGCSRIQRLEFIVDGFGLVGAFFVAWVAIGAGAVCNGANTIALRARGGGGAGATWVISGLCCLSALAIVISDFGKCWSGWCCR